MSDAGGRGRRSDPNRAVKPSWRVVSVRGGNGLELAGNERVVALVRWLRGEGARDQQFVDSLKNRVIVDPMEVNWARFPLQEAMAAVSMDDGRGSGVRVRPSAAAMSEAQAAAEQEDDAAGRVEARTRPR